MITNNKFLVFIAFIGITTHIFSHGWYGRGYDAHRYCRGYNDTRGFSKYGFRRKGGVLDGKAFEWHGSQRIWWNGNEPYVRHKGLWLPWKTVFPTINPPKKCNC